MRTIDADALIARLEEEAEQMEDPIAIMFTYGAINDIKHEPTITVPQWIPVSERLPEESGLYQVTDMQGNVVRYVFNANEGSVEYWRRCVKAWMPLPEPYKEDKG